MNLRQSSEKGESLSPSLLPLASPRPQCLSPLSGFVSERSEAGHGWASQDLVRSTSKKEAVHWGEVL